MESIRPAFSAEQANLLKYLKADLGNCLYISLDIETFGLEGDKISVWVQETLNDEYVLVAMKFADSFQLYCREADFGRVDVERLADLMRPYCPNRIFGPRKLIDALMRLWQNEYDVSYGFVLEFKKYRRFNSDDVHIEIASAEDIPEIVDLIMMDEELGQSYDREKFIDQLTSSLSDGTGASYIIRADDGKIVAHVAFSMISTECVIVAYMIVHPEYRDFPYGAFLDAYYINDLLPAMGKRGFAFMHDKRRIALFKAMKNEVLGEYGKMLRKGV